MTIISEAQKEFQQLQASIRRDNKKLDILQKLIQEYNGTQPNTTKLNELIMQCLRDHEGHADFDEIVNFLVAQYAFLSRQRISLALTKCPFVEFSKSKERWELSQAPTGKGQPEPDRNILSHH